MALLLTFLLGAASLGLFFCYYAIDIAKQQIKGLNDCMRELTEDNKKILSQKKSSEVRVGQIAENLAPFLKDFKYDPKTCHFLGQPIDYIVYSEDEVVFIEVKSGGAKLSTKQRRIRDNIQNGRVRFEEFRVE